MNQTKRSYLTERNPAGGLLLFALPMIFGNLFQQFYNMADSMIVGNYVGEEALAAVGASYALTTVFIMVAIGGGNGAAVLTSQYLGAGRYKEMKTSISTALISFLMLSFVLGAFGFLFHGTILELLHTPSDAMGQAKLYLAIYFLGLPFLFMYNVQAAVFHAMGDSVTPLCLLIFSSILNVALDIVSVAGWEMGVAGVAIATVFAQGLAAVVSFLILRRKLKKYGDAGESRAPLFDWEMLKNGTKIAVPTTLQQSIVSIGMLLVQSVVNGFGSSVLAGYTAASRIDSICIVPMIATGNAVATFTAQNIGAGKLDRVKKGYQASYAIIAGFAVIIALVLHLFREPIIAGFLGSQRSAVAFETGVSYLSFIGYFTFFLGAKACVDGVLRGSGDMLVFTVANLVNLTIRVTGAFLLAPVWGVAAVWCVVPMGWISNYLISFVRYLTGKWKTARVI